MRMRVTVVAEYDTHPDNYTSTDPHKMAAEDLHYFLENPVEILYVPQRDDIIVKVQPVNA